MSPKRRERGASLSAMASLSNEQPKAAEEPSTNGVLQVNASAYDQKEEVIGKVRERYQSHAIPLALTRPTTAPPVPPPLPKLLHLPKAQPLKPLKPPLWKQRRMHRRKAKPLLLRPLLVKPNWKR